jgi:hypothetical protein
MTSFVSDLTRHIGILTAGHGPVLTVQKVRVWQLSSAVVGTYSAGKMITVSFLFPDFMMIYYFITTVYIACALMTLPVTRLDLIEVFFRLSVFIVLWHPEANRQINRTIAICSSAR